jgi:hypothetical protein
MRPRTQSTGEEKGKKISTFFKKEEQSGKIIKNRNNEKEGINKLK